jgi:hypothetical protein
LELAAALQQLSGKVVSGISETQRRFSSQQKFGLALFAMITLLLVGAAAGFVLTGGTLFPKRLASTSTASRTPDQSTQATVSTNERNLALNKKATGSLPCQSSETPDKAVNGSWVNSISWCTYSGKAMWWQVDLGAPYSLSKIVIYHAGAGGEPTIWNTRNFNIQVSVDGTNWETVERVKDNTSNVSIHTPDSVVARYVKILVTTPEYGSGGAARIYEVEVFGK